MSTVTSLHVVDFAERTLEQALAISRALPAVAEELEQAVLVTSRVAGPAWVIGSRQRSHRFEGPAKVFRRSTTGTAVFIEKTALLHALAIPRVNAVFADATPRTLLNRNVRGFLRGYRGLGVKANWGGREYFRAVAAPLGLLAYDLRESGSVIVEAWVGLETPAVRFASKPEASGAALFDLLPAGPPPEQVAATVARGLADKYGLARVSLAPGAVPEAPPPAEEAPELPSFVEISVPIGRLEGAVERGARTQVLLRGDVLSSNAALDATEQRAVLALDSGEGLTTSVVAPLLDAPLEGARPEDVLHVLERALAIG